MLRFAGLLLLVVVLGCALAVLAGRREMARREPEVGHGIAVDPTQWVALVPGAGELVYGRLGVYGDTFSEAHRRRQETAYRLRGTRSALLTFIRRQYTIDGLRLVTGTYEDIAVPVLQIHGSEDASILVDAARGLSPRLADTRFVLVEGASHDVHVEAVSRVAREIVAFAGGLEP